MECMNFRVPAGAVNDIINCRLLQSAQSSKPVDRDDLFCTQLLDTKSKELIILHRFSPGRYLRRVKDMIADGPLQNYLSGTRDNTDRIQFKSRG